MFRFLPKLSLASTAFAPVLFTCAAVLFFQKSYGWMAALLSFALFLVLVCVWVMRAAKRDLSPNPVSIKSLKPADKELLGFLLAYLLPLARGTGTVFEPVPLGIALAMFFFVVMSSNAYHTNPLLGLLGYHFYDVVVEEVGYVLITKKNLHNTRAIKQVVSITDYMLLDVSE